LPVDAWQQIADADQVDQVRGRDRRQLPGVAVGELPQELANVAHAYTPPNNRPVPPARITSRSSMLSAAAAVPATIEVILPGGFTAAEATLLALIATFAEISSDSPARSARPITGANPANDTRFSSSNNGVARDHP
jgi:hypothetical protein